MATQNIKSLLKNTQENKNFKILPDEILSQFNYIKIDFTKKVQILESNAETKEKYMVVV